MDNEQEPRSGFNNLLQVLNTSYDLMKTIVISTLKYIAKTFFK